MNKIMKLEKNKCHCEMKKKKILVQKYGKKSADEFKNIRLTRFLTGYQI